MDTTPPAVNAAGSHIAMNAIAALLAAQELDADVARGADELANFAALKGRGARFLAGGVEVIDESYNANPASMAAAIELLAKAEPHSGGRRIAALGDMRELGPESGALHKALSRNIAAASTERHADPDFVRSARHGVRHDSIQTDTCQHQCHHAKGTCNLSHETLLNE